MSLFPSSSTRLVRDLLLRAPVLSHLASDKVRTSLRQRRISLGLNRHQVQGFRSSPVRELSPAPGNLHCPRKLSVPRRVQGLGSQLHRIVYVFKGWDSGRIKSCGSKPTPSRAHCPIPSEKLSLGEGAIDIKRYFVAHHIVTSPRKLVRYRLNRHHPVSLGLLPLIISSDERVKANRKIRCLHKRPRQILVAVFRVASSFAFAVGKLLTSHTPTVRGKVPHLRKSPDVPGLQHDGQRQGLTNAVDRQQIPIPRPEFDSLHNRNLSLQTSHHHEVGFHCQRHLRVRKLRIDLFARELLDTIGADRLSRVT